jgi:hypothetical protein
MAFSFRRFLASKENESTADYARLRATCGYLLTTKWGSTILNKSLIFLRFSRKLIAQLYYKKIRALRRHGHDGREFF